MWWKIQTETYTEGSSFQLEATFMELLSDSLGTVSKKIIHNSWKGY